MKNARAVGRLSNGPRFCAAQPPGFEDDASGSRDAGDFHRRPPKDGGCDGEPDLVFLRPRRGSVLANTGAIVDAKTKGSGPEALLDDSMHREDHAHLLGCAPASEFAEFLRLKAHDLPPVRQQLLLQEWRTAARARQEEMEERASLNEASVMPLPESVQEMAARDLMDESITRALGPIPYHWAMVDLNQLMVCQKWVNLEHSRQLESDPRNDLTVEELYRIAAGHGGRLPDLRVVRASENVFTFSSSSRDLRFLEVTALSPEMLSGYSTLAKPAGLIAAFVGFGVNIINAARVRGRLILINGTHRAHMLYGLGIRSVPCLVREVGTEEDLNLICLPDVRQQLASYLTAPHPPLLRDFFDPKLCKVVPIQRTQQLIHIQFNTQRSRVAAG